MLTPADIKELKEIEAMAAVLLTRSSKLRKLAESQQIKPVKKSKVSDELKNKIRTTVWKGHKRRGVENAA